MTIVLPPDLEQRVKDEAAQAGLDPNEYAQQLIRRSLRLPTHPQTLGELFAEWQAEDHTDDPEELARREREGEEFMQALARNRIEMEGPNARKLWP